MVLLILILRGSLEVLWSYFFHILSGFTSNETCIIFFLNPPPSIIIIVICTIFAWDPSEDGEELGFRATRCLISGQHMCDFSFGNLINCVRWNFTEILHHCRLRASANHLFGKPCKMCAWVGHTRHNKVVVMNFVSRYASCDPLEVDSILHSTIDCK